MTASQDCTSAIIAQLIVQGVTDVVLSPGSRSAPLALAAAKADKDNLIRLHVRVDERGAGFLALGLGKASGRPAAVVTTSGTAVGNLLPAVMEAAHAGVPLVVVTADRPASLVGFGANQTTDQRGLFDRYARWSAVLDSRADADSWFAQTARAVLASRGSLGPLPGPVHLDVHLGVPLVSDDPVALPTARPRRHVGRSEPAAFELPAGPRTVVVAGDAKPAVGRRVAALAAQARVPLIAEPSSNARFGAALTHGRLLLDTPLAADIERVVVVGHPTLSRPVSALLARADVELVVEGSSAGWPDAGWQATLFADRVAIPAGDPQWAQRWRRADVDLGSAGARLGEDPAAGAARRADSALASETRALTGLTLAWAVWESLPADAPLVIGSSSPIRDLDVAPVGPSSPLVFANRGLAGIDGTLSTALGVALALGAPTTLYCGDLTFVHDATALAAAPTEPRPDLRVVVADNYGGALFATLEYGRPAFADVFERIFATPTGARVADVARGFGARVREVTTLDQLVATLERPWSGLEVVVAAVSR